MLAVKYPKCQTLSVRDCRFLCIRRVLAIALLTLPDRVFAHALHTVKRIPRTGSARPPPVDRLTLYGLYKQSTGTYCHDSAP